MLDFRIKICGITNERDALMAVEAGADAIGINFFSGSKRFVGDVRRARAIVSCVNGRAKTIGVFVNSSKQEVAEKFQTLNLDFVQLHGDETPKFAKSIKLPLIKAIGVSSESSHFEISQHRQWIEIENVLGLMLDTVSSGTFGGTGKSFDWKNVQIDMIRDKKIILAGGLTPENVAKAVNVVRPDAVDVASGVEDSAGVKNAEKTRLFVQNAVQAFASSH